MTTYFKIFTFLILTSLSSCNSKAQVHSDLNDLGYKGKIKTIVTKIYYMIGQVQNNWEVIDTTKTSTTIINYFNRDGNFTKRIEIIYGTTEHQYTYHYSGKTKIGWTDTDINGNVIETGKFTYNGKMSFTETRYDTSGLRIFESIYTLDETQRTKTLEDIGYKKDPFGWEENEMRVWLHLFTIFQRTEAGHLYKMSTEDKLLKGTDNDEHEILEKDKFNNPISILVKNNGIPREIRKLTIDYLDK